MIKVPESGVIETSAAYNWVENGILYSIAKDKAYLDLDAAKEIRAAFYKLTKEPLPLFVDLHTTSGQSSEARDFFSKDPEHIAILKATALYATNPVARVVGNIYMGLVKAEIPVKLFGDYDKAIQWLKQFQ